MPKPHEDRFERLKRESALASLKSKLPPELVRELGIVIRSSEHVYRNVTEMFDNEFTSEPDIQATLEKLAKELEDA